MLPGSTTGLWDYVVCCKRDTFQNHGHGPKFLLVFQNYLLPCIDKLTLFPLAEILGGLVESNINTFRGIQFGWEQCKHKAW